MSACPDFTKWTNHTCYDETDKKWAGTKSCFHKSLWKMWLWLGVPCAAPSPLNMGFARAASQQAEILWMRSHEHSWPPRVPLQGLQYSHILPHTSLLTTRVTVFASPSKIFSLCLTWRNLGTHGSFLLMTGDLRAGAKRCVDMNQSPLHAWQWCCGTFLSLELLQGLAPCRTYVNFNSFPLRLRLHQSAELQPCSRACHLSFPEYPVLKTLLFLVLAQILCKQYSLQWFACLFLVHFLLAAFLYFLLNSKEKVLFI